MSFVSPRRLNEYHRGAVSPLWSSIAATETSPTTAAHLAGEYLFYNHVLYKATVDIAIGDTLAVGTNIAEATVMGEVASGGGGGGGTPATVVIPTVTIGTYTYNGTAQGPTITSMDQTKVGILGDATATNVGSYTLYLYLLDPARSQWADGTTEPKPYQWSISKAPGSVTLSKNSVTLATGAESDTVTISGATGAITITSSDTDIATVSPASMSATGGTLTISSPYSDSGSATVAVSVAATENTEATSAVISVDATGFPEVYGVEWDGTSTTAWSRTDAAALYTDPVPAISNGAGSSPFDTISPWKDMERVTDSAAGTLVSIPKFYYKWTKTGTAMKLQICMAQKPGYQVAPAFMDRGDGKGERDTVYVGAYHCGETAYKSAAGQKPKASQTRSAFRTAIHNLGSTIWQWDYAMLETIWMLYLVEFADWNSQAKIGYGCGNNSSAESMGLTDAMQYHTGTNAANRTTYGHTRYRWIEDLWGNVLDWCDGIYFSGADIYVIKNPSNFSDTANGTKVGTRPTSGGYTSAWQFSDASGFDWFLYPSDVSGSDSTYTADYCDYDASGVVLHVGGNYSQYQGRGLFYLDGYYTASISRGGFGSRLQKLP